MSCIPYANIVGSLMNVMKWSDISHVDSVVSDHMENTAEALKRVLKYFKGTSVTYNGYSHLVYGLYFVASMDKRISTPSYVSKYNFGR